MDGWIKLHRKIMEWKYFKNSEVYHVFSTLVLLANHKEGFTKDGTKIERGQLMTSAKSLSEITGLNESKIFRIIEKLKIEKQIEKQASSKSSIITVINYEDYQGDEEHFEEQVKSGRRTSEEQVKTNKNVNNNKNEKNNNIIKASPLSFLFNHRPDIQAWLDRGNHDTHAVIISKEKSHHELVELIEKAFDWAQPRNQRAETWLLTFVTNKKAYGYGSNQAKKAVLDPSPVPTLNEEEIQILKAAGQI